MTHLSVQVVSSFSFSFLLSFFFFFLSNYCLKRGRFHLPSNQYKWNFPSIWVVKYEKFIPLFLSKPDMLFFNNKKKLRPILSKLGIGYTNHFCNKIPSIWEFKYESLSPSFLNQISYINNKKLRPITVKLGIGYMNHFCHQILI